MGTELSTPILNELTTHFYIHKQNSLEQLQQHLDNQSILSLPDIILLETDPSGDCFTFIEMVKKNPLWRDLIIVLIATEKNKDWKSRALQLKVHDYYIIPFPLEHLIERLNFLVEFKLKKPPFSELKNEDIIYKLPLSKKIFDIFVSASAIILLSPVLLLTALLIRLDFKGAVIYKSKRVGTGYNIFNFYKFRSTNNEADEQFEDLSRLERYAPEVYAEKKAAAVALKDPPGITRLGNFIRSTCIDELPQLFNVLKGDMSLVGNKPLSLHEAEMLTSNEWSLRFMGPAGLTGLWQIKSREGREISDRERRKFDNFYALKYSFWFDLEILMKALLRFRLFR